MNKKRQNNATGQRSLRSLHQHHQVKIAVLREKYTEKPFCEYTVYTPQAIRSLRASLGLNQTEFWGAVGVRQTAGSRYEKGLNELPIQVSMLIEITYERGINLSSVKNREKIEAAIKDCQLERI